MPSQSRLVHCEACGWEVMVPALECRCAGCGGVAYADPFPSAEAKRRLDALSERLEAEDGAGADWLPQRGKPKKGIIAE